MWPRCLQLDCHFGAILGHCIESLNHGASFTFRKSKGKMVKRAEFVQQFIGTEYFCIYIFKLNFESLFQVFLKL